MKIHIQVGTHVLGEEKGKVVRTPSGVSGRSLSLIQLHEAPKELSLPPGHVHVHVHLMQGTFPT